MTKRELIELLKDIDDDALIGAFWDDCHWPIHGVATKHEGRFKGVYEAGGSTSEYQALINCS